RFFCAANPGFADGHGLVTVVPVDARTLGDLLAGTARRKARAPVSAATAFVESTPLGAGAARGRQLSHERAAGRLRGAGRAAHGKRGVGWGSVGGAGGGRVFARGDVSDELYRLAAGAVYVVAEGEIVDELATGAVFGELAMLAGERRSAEIRTATTSMLVRIP